MSLSHSKTWPTCSLAIVQLKISSNGKAYSTILNQEAITANIVITMDEQDDEKIDDKLSETQVSTLELSESVPISSINRLRHLSPDVEKNIEQCRLDGSIFLRCNRYGKRLSVNHTCHCISMRQKRLIRRARSTSVTKVDVEAAKIAMRTRSKSVPSPSEVKRQDIDNILDDNFNEACPIGRKAATLRRHYYPEGGWGWVVVGAAVLTGILGTGLQFASPFFLIPAGKRFDVHPGQATGK